ncbi:MAG: aminopeptidase P family protein [Clostridiales bacterium]|nr:aminopeptidase P family protein [Clostridiales bacterium]
MDVRERIQRLRQKMAEMNMDAYVIPSSDPHMSEYVAPRWQSRKWLSGFTGSAGTLVITRDTGGLWTDGRYFIQAEEQLKGTGIKLFKMGMPGVPDYIEWLKQSLPENSRIGICGEVFPASRVREMENKLSQKRINIIKEYDLVDDIWEDRPSAPSEPVFNHDVAFAGLTAARKLSKVREEMAKKGVNYHLICSLDDIAWLYNIRGSDVAYNPVAMAHALVSDTRAWLFIDRSKVSDEVRSTLEDNGVTVEDYARVYDYLAKLKDNDKILLDPDRTNSWLYDAITGECIKVEDTNITTRLKAVKNEVEIENLKKAHISDGVAMVKFLYWLDCNLGKQKITEITVAEKLEEFRRQQENFIGPSFATIAAYKDHAAMMHYQATDETCYELDQEGMLLIDSGGQYLGGTTDITRTIILGSITDVQRRDFTLVLKGHINLAKARMLYGVTGSNVDILARLPIWEVGIDYKCGTGHGVGYFLNVHEGPQRMSQVPNTVKLEKGMIITNEPGIYIEGQYGIRTENEMLVVEDCETEFGEFIKFEPVTYCPIDLDGIDADLLSDDEKIWLNDYHEMVYRILSPFLEEDEREWLRNETRSI